MIKLVMTNQAMTKKIR